MRKKLFSIIGREQGSAGRAPVFLAPMAGITDNVFRKLCVLQGCDFTFTEMISAKGIHYNSSKTRELLRTGELERPCGVQLFGSDPDIMAQTARRIEAEYSGQIALIDINMGCPAPKITGNGEGSALMRNPSLAAKIISAVSAAVKLPVSVKFRKGWDEDHVNAVEFARMAQDSGAAFVTVHGRTRRQMYEGKADWDIIARVKEAVSIPVVGNGDIFSGESAVRMLEHTGCDGIMAARGAQGNPFLFAQICAAQSCGRCAEPSPSERILMAIRHAEEFLTQRDTGAFVELRKHMAWYTKGIYGSTQLRRRINTCADAGELMNLMREFLENCRMQSASVPAQGDAPAAH